MRTPGMEDHLEQIYLLSLENGYTRVSDVAKALSIHSSSATKMARKLGEAGYVLYEKYGRICLTEKGQKLGRRLIYRHQLLERFFREIGVPEEEIQDEVEQIETYFSWSTIQRVEKLVEFLEEQQDRSLRSSSS